MREIETLGANNMKVEEQVQENLLVKHEKMELSIGTHVAFVNKQIWFVYILY